MTDEMYRILAIKTWVPVPKYEGANRVEKLCDLELGNKSKNCFAEY